MSFGLYVHVPFCSRKCPYCDFYSISALDLISLWLEGLAREAGLLAPFWTAPFDTLFLGGGSPSLLNKTELKGLLAALSSLKLAGGSEITIEANPEDVTPEKAAVWADLGINRVSLGVQSFSEKWLVQSLGRTHTPYDNQKAIEAVAAAGLRLSLDLIYAHAGQTPEDWAADLDAASAGWADHISAYVLTAAPGTPLAKALENKLAPRLPGEEAASELFLLTIEALKKKDFKNYEVSNFARGGAECRHNLKYWRREPYLGLGPSAHSFDGSKRWANVPSVRRWAVALAGGQRALEFSEDITSAQAHLEQVMLGLRLAEGFEISLVRPSEALDNFLNEGYLTIEGSRLKPTPKGLLVADSLARTLA
jgi:oxygen-independent coproporphyrinogen-3 oxidase